MAITVKHKFVSAIPDAGDPTIVQPSNWNDDHQLTGTIPVDNGGTGASTLTGYVKGNGTSAMTASATVPSTDITGLGTMSTQNANNVTITGGSISGTTVSGYIPTTEKAVANGVATLDGSGTVPISQLPSAVLGALSYQGTWNASTNTPTLTSSVGTKGYYYVVNVAGSTNLNGVTDWQIGDWAVYNGSAWQKVDNTDQVTSVNGKTGTVVLGYGDITTGVVPVVNGGTGVTVSSGANSVVLRDANGNITTNCLFEGFSTQAASVTTIVLTASSVQNWQITGSGGQTIRLPDATTLPNGATFTFNNNQSSGTIIVQNNSSTTVATINSGGYVTVVLLSNSIAAGSWDRHDSTPSNVSWSTNTLDYAGSITSATWNGSTVQVNRGGTGASTLTGYVKGSGTSALTAASTIPTTDLSGTVTNAQLANSAITINGTSTSLGGSINVGTVTSVTGTSPIVSSGGTTPAISMPAANTTTNGYLTSTDWNTFNGKSNTNGTVTSVAALTLGTTGTDLSSTVATGTTTPVITLQVPTASATNRGALSAVDWTTFNNKGSGTVTSVGLSAPSIFTVSGSPITGSGTLALTYSGTALPILNGGTGATTASTAFNALSPLTTAGDTLYGGTSGAGTRLGIGTAGQVLTVNAGATAPQWSTPTTGTVTAVSVVSANGFAGTSSGGATPALTLSTSITGVLKGNGTAISAATAGTDYSVGTSANTSGLVYSTTTTGALTTATGAQVSTALGSTNISGNAANVTGIVAATNGGTAQSTYTTGDILYASATNTLSKLPVGSTGQVLTVAGGIPSWATAAAGGGISWQAVQTTGFTAVSGNGYAVNTTSAAITVTLPSSASAGNQIAIVDYAGTAATNNITINPNGLNLNGASNNALISTKREGVLLTYIDSTQGWLVTLSNTLTVPQTYTATYLIVAGGGGGSGYCSGGGGAGGLLSGTSTLTSGTVYSFGVGSGGAGSTGTATAGVQGNNSTGFSLTAIGGGGGGVGGGGSGAPTSGGSGGGGASTVANLIGGSGTTGQGYAGGNSGGSAGTYSSGGGGGASAVGGTSLTTGAGADGGAGTASSVTGSSVTYAGGGGGGSYGAGGGAGGAGGGGAGGTSPVSGTVNTGGGGGGYAAAGAGTGGSGGSGVVIISIPTARYTGTSTGSPTVTTSGSNTILKFTASGSYTA